MKKEIEICDNCKKSLAKTRCDFCKNDLCNRCTKKTRLAIGPTLSIITEVNLYSKCNKKMSWDGELSDDIKDIIINQIKARVMLKTIEE
jgi:hypothetical protein